MVFWPGKSNGRIALSEMRDTVGDGRESSYLHPAAAYNFKKMQAACFAETGIWIDVEEGYRSYETQAWYAGPNSPLPAGTAVAAVGGSKHGWGLAVDIKNYAAAFEWLLANAARFGFDWTEGRNSNEKWHWVYVGSLDTTGLNFDEIEDDMFTDTDRAEQRILLGSQARVELSTYQIKRWLKEDGPDSIMGKLDLILYLIQGNKKPTDPSILRLLNEISADIAKVSDAADSTDKK